jgi:hypothetical protein
MNCFGKFALSRKLYGFNETIGDNFVEDPKYRGVIHTIAMFCFIIPYEITGVLDLLFFNIYEYWKGENLLGLNEFDKEGNLTKTFPVGNEKIKFRYSGFGSKLEIEFKNNSSQEVYTLFRNEKGKIYKETDSGLKEVSFNEFSLDKKSLLLSFNAGKLNSMKLVESKSIQDLEKSILDK